MKNQYTIEIDAAPERVFYWLDDPQRLKKWIPNLVEHEDLEPTESKVGTTFRQVFDENGRRMEMEGVVTAYEKNKRFACEMSGSMFDLMVDYKLEDLGGQTRVTQNSDGRFKGFYKVVGLVMLPFMKKSSQKHLDDTFATLKRLAESGEAVADS